jgi:hypothetical protein
MQQFRRWCADAALAVSFLGIERPPFGATVDFIFVDDEPAVGADRLTVLSIAL